MPAALVRKLVDALFGPVFGCGHQRTTFPITTKITPKDAPQTRVICLDCGAAFQYDWDAMRIGKQMPAAAPVHPTGAFAPPHLTAPVEKIRAAQKARVVLLKKKGGRS